MILTLASIFAVAQVFVLGRNLKRTLLAAFIAFLSVSVQVGTAQAAAAQVVNVEGSQQSLKNDARRLLMLRDYVQLAPVLERLAELGDADAAYQLAGLYRNGQGVERDFQKAAYWAGLAAQNHHSAASYLLATLCEQEIECDPQAIELLYIQAASDGYEPAKKQLQALRESKPLPAPDVRQFWLAARRGDLQKLQQQRAAGVDIHSVDEEGRSALLMATDARQADAVFWLLEQGANPNLSDRVGDRPLHLAAQRGDANILAALIRAGAELDAVDAGGNSALMLALKAEHLKPVTQLLDAGADPNITNQRHENPLSQARHREMKEAETLLLSRGARMPQKAQPQLAMKTALEQSEQSLFKGWPALSVAAWLGQSERVERLLKQGANPNETGPGGHTALTRAAWRGQPDIVQQLLTAGARIDQTDDSGRTPLSWALSSEVNISSATNADETGDQTLATVSRLLAASSTAAVNLLDNSGHTPLWYAVTSQLPERLQQALVARLLKAGAEPDLQGADATPVLIAAVNALLDSTAHKQGLVIKQLLASGSDVNQTDNKGRDALWYAANQGRTDVLEILIAAGAQGQSADEQGHRAIERCVVSRSPECLQGLLSVSHDKAEFQKHTTKQGNSLLLLAASLPEDDALAMFEQLNSASSLQLDQKNNDGDTALMQAAAHGNERLVARLMKAGADPWLRNHSKQSAADLARMAGHEALAANLEQSGDKSGYWWKLLTGSDGR